LNWFNPSIAHQRFRSSEHVFGPLRGRRCQFAAHRQVPHLWQVRPMTGVDNTAALAALHRCQTNLVAARADTLHATADLRGARAARAFELGELLADVLAFCSRLAFVVAGDHQAQQGKLDAE
jgi:hypothetical protein